MNRTDAQPTNGLLIVGHGTRDVEGRREFEQVVELAAARAPELLVGPAYLELAEPDIPAGIQHLISRGAQAIHVAPLLLFAAGHAREDIPRLLDAARQAHPHVPIRLGGVLGCHPAIVELSAHRYREAIENLAPVAAAETILVLVGRGSRDESATAEMLRFAQLRAEQTPVAQVETCFVAMARPSLTEMLGSVASGPWRRVVVQPHLLFRGQLLDEVAVAVARQQAAFSEKEWVIAGRLGVRQQVIDVVLQR